MLCVDPEKRPNINQILNYPVIKQRISMLLDADDFKDEFSHTILHNQNVFDEFKAIQAKKKEDEKKKADEEEALKKMEQMKLNEY